MRVYKVRQKSTGLYFIGLPWNRNKKPHIKPGFEKSADFWKIEQLNYNIERLIVLGFSNYLDDLEIESFEVVEPQPVKSKLKIKNVRDRIERNLIVSKLKAG